MYLHLSLFLHYVSNNEHGHTIQQLAYLVCLRYLFLSIDKTYNVFSVNIPYLNLFILRNLNQLFVGKNCKYIFIFVSFFLFVSLISEHPIIICLILVRIMSVKF